MKIICVLLICIIFKRVLAHLFTNCFIDLSAAIHEFNLHPDGF